MSVNTVDSNGNLLRVAGGTLYAGAPIGTISPFGGSAIPSGYLLCDGQAVSRTNYAELFAVIGTSFGTGDGSTTFNVPDLREATTKGVGLSGKSSNHYDSDGVALGEFVEDRIKSHTHSMNHTHTFSGTTGAMNSNASHTHTTNGFESISVAKSGFGYAGYLNGTGIQTTNATDTNHTHNYSGTTSNASTSTTGSTGSATTEVKAVGVNYIIKAKDVNLSGGGQALADRVETLETLTSDVIPSGASASNKLAARSDIYILSNQYNGATYTTVNALLEKVAADMLAKGGYGGAVGSVWTGKSYFSGTYGTNGSTAGNARLHFENAQGGYTECAFNFSSSGLGTVNWFNDVTTSTVTQNSTAPITSGGIYDALNNKTSVTATSGNTIYMGTNTIYYYPQTKRMLFNQCYFVYTQGPTMPGGKTLCTITIPNGITIPEKGIMIPAMLSVPETGEKLPSAVMLNPDGTIVTTNKETDYQEVSIYGANVFFE